MIQGLSVALLIVGVALVIWGMRAAQAFNSEVSEIFTGSPTDKAIWLLVAGIVAGVVGLFGLLRGRGGRR